MSINHSKQTGGADHASRSIRTAQSSFPLLVADAGGTNVRFAWMAHAHAPLTEIESFVCEQYASPQDAANAYLQARRAKADHTGASLAGVNSDTLPARAAIAIASAVTSGPIKLTNSHWVLDRAAFAKATGINTVDVFNDFEAIALGLPFLAAHEYALVGTAKPDPTEAMAVIGPGTGLGVGGIVPVRSHPGIWQAVCGEGGHATLAGSSAYQQEILRAAHEIARGFTSQGLAPSAFPHVSAERLISGIGLPTLRQAVAQVEGLPLVGELNAEEIGTRGTARTDHLCTQTMEAFCSLLGCVAGNLALTLGARGGVYIGGGIVPKLGDFFHQSGFRQHFEAKGRYTSYLQNISTAVIISPYPGLQGLAQHAGHNDINKP